MTRITFPQPADYLNLNQRLHWAPKMRLTAAWREAARIAALKLGRNKLRRRHSRSYIHVSYPVKQCRRRDAHNWTPTTKAIIDGLVDAGVWEDDTTDHVVMLDCTFHRGEGVIVTITPAQEAA